MKLLLLLLLLSIGLFSLSCTTPSKTTQQMSEKFLIHTRYKVIEHGYFKFLELKDSVPIKEITFIYNIDKKSREFSISLLNNKEVNFDYNIKDFKNSQEWNSKQHNSYREQYYKVINENFLHISNEAKFKLLDSLTVDEK